MIGFIVGALLLALLAAGFLVWPLLRRDNVAGAPVAAIGGLVLIVAASVLLYALLGSHAWLKAAISGTAGADTNQQIATLARHLERTPADQAGWLALGGAYEGVMQYTLAMRAYERADRLAGGSNAAALAGIGEALLLGAGSGPDAQQQAAVYFERALRIDPQSPKALFYSAIIAYQQGQLQLARDRFSTMLSMSPAPPQNIRTALQHQIDDIDAQLHPPVDAATAITVHVTLAAALAAKVPNGASLFVFVRSSAGPPLAVKRSAATLPQDVTLSAADAMIAGHGITAGQKVAVVARISAAGGPLAQSGDLYGQIDGVAGKSGVHALQIDQVTP